jgi:MFS family permease
MTRLVDTPPRPSVLPVVLAGFTAFLDLYVTQPLLPLLMRVFGASRFAVSLTVTASTLGVAAAAPFVGRLADLIGRKRVIVGSSFMLAGATALAATAASLTQFIGWRVVQGLVTPGIFAVTIAYIHEQYPVSYTGRATAAYVSGTVIGGFCGRVLAGLIAGAMTWQAAFAVLAAVTALAATALGAFLPRDRGAAVHAELGRRQALVQLLHRQLAATDIIGFCSLFSLVAMFTYVTFHLEAPPYRLGTAALGWLFVVYLVGAAVTPIAGRWVDAYGHRRALSAAMTVGASGAALTLAAPLWSVVIGLALVGTGVFVAQAAASSYIGSITTQHRGVAVGLYSSAYYVGGSAGGALPALVWEHGGWTVCVLLVIAVQAFTQLVAWTAWTPGAPRVSHLAGRS